MRNALLLALVLGVSAFARMSEAAPAASATAPDSDAAAVMMAAELSHAVNVLTREVSTYHWQPRRIVGVAETGLVDPADPRALGYFSGTAGSFWGNYTNNRMMGNGIYVATDPIISQGYGGDADTWALLVANLPAGTRILDVRERLIFSNELRARLQTSGCGPWNDLLGFILRSSTVVPPEACANIYYQAFRLLGVQGTAYDWSGVSIAACAIRNSWSDPALVLYDPALAANTRVLVKEIPAAEPAEIHDLRIRVTQYFRLQNQGFSWGSFYPWPSLSDLPAPVDMIEWIQSHTYFCDSANWEDLLPSQLAVSPGELVEKREEIQEKAELVSAKLGRPIRPELFRGVLSLLYFPPSQLQYTSGVDVLDSPEFRAWLEVQTHSVMSAARQRAPLSSQALLGWAKSWALPASETPSWASDRAEPALSALIAELSAPLFHPRQASARDQPLLMDTAALISAYHTRILALAPLTRFNDRLTRALVDYIAEIRGWPPILIRTTLDEVSPLGSLKAVVIMDKCLDRYLNATVTPGSACEMLSPADAQ
jgi:hypothetical protein